MFYSKHIVSNAKIVVNHVKKHNHKYLFLIGLAGGAFLFMKILMLFGASYMLYNASNDSTFADDFVITGEVNTGVTNTGVIYTGSIDTGDIYTGYIDTGYIDTGVVNTGIVNTGIVNTGEIYYNTGSNTGTVSDLTGFVNTGNINTGDNSTGNQEAYGFQSISVCDYSGFSSNISSGRAYSGVMNLSWTISPNCSNNNVIIKLYDHNENRITLATVSGTATQYSFDTKLLFSGYYLKTGLNASGLVVTFVPGVFSGISTDNWTGYRIRWFIEPDMILNETQNFVIDNRKPILSNVSLGYSDYLSGMVGVGKTVNLKFMSSESLTGINVYVNSKTGYFVQLSGNNYTYNSTLSGSNSGYLSYVITYQDLVGNTGYYSGISNLFYDPIYPQMTGFSLSGYNFSFMTSKSTASNSFVLFKGTANGWAFAVTGFVTGHTFSLPTLSLNTDYDLGIVIRDQGGNEGKAALSLNRNASGNITFNLLATLYGGVLTTYSSGTNFLSTTGYIQTNANIITGQQELIVTKFKQEIDKFTECKDNIEYTKIKLQIKGVEIQLNMPMFQKDEIKKLVNSFVLYILKSLEKSPLSEDELNDIAQNFDGFSVILKLIKDDNNVCKQNLTNYHLKQFRESLDTYGINL